MVRPFNVPSRVTLGVISTDRLETLDPLTMVGCAPGIGQITGQSVGFIDSGLV